MNDNDTITTDAECTIMSQKVIPDCPDCDFEYLCDWDRDNCRLKFSILHMIRCYINKV